MTQQSVDAIGNVGDLEPWWDDLDPKTIGRRRKAWIDRHRMLVQKCMAKAEEGCTSLLFPLDSEIWLN